MRKQAGTQPLQGLNPQNMPRISICMIMNAANGMLLLTHLESSTRASGRGSAPSLMASNHTRGSRLGTATKGFMSLLETCFCWVSSKLPTAPWLSSVATPVGDNRRTAASPSPFLLAPRRATAAVCCCVNRASPVLRRTAAAAEPAAPLPTLDTGAERKESVGPRDSNPAATASTMDSLLDSDPPRPLCCCSCRPMVVVSVLIVLMNPGGREKRTQTQVGVTTYKSQQSRCPRIRHRARFFFCPTASRVTDRVSVCQRNTGSIKQGWRRNAPLNLLELL